MKRVLLICILAFCALSLPAQSTAQKEKRINQLKEEIDQIDNLLKGISSKQKTTNQNIALIHKKVTARKQVIDEINREIKSKDAVIHSKSREITMLQRELDTLTSYYSRLIYNTYKNRDTKLWFMYVLSSQNIGQGYRRISYLKNLSNEVNLQGEQIKELRTRLEQERAAIESERASALAMRKSREKELKQLKGEEADSTKLAKELKRNQTRYKKDIDKKRKELERLNREIEAMVNRTISDQKKKNVRIDYKLSDEFGQNRGKLPWPVRSGVIIERFGVHKHPVYKNVKDGFNKGMTFTASADSDALCVFNGVVLYISQLPGYGYNVMVQHGRYFTIYCNIDKLYVKSGQTVKTGTPLGRLQVKEGVSMMQFQLWQGGDVQDPEVWLKPHQ